MQKVHVEHHTVIGGFWFAAWLFSIGFLKMGFLKAVLAIVLWPYFLGVALSGAI